MGNNVTTTPVQVMKIDDNNKDDKQDGNDIHSINDKNKINDSSYEDYNTEHQNSYLDDYKNDEHFNADWNYNQQYMGYPNEGTTETITNEINPVNNVTEEKLNSVKEYNNERKDVFNEILDQKSSHDTNPMRTTSIARMPNLEKTYSLPVVVKSFDGNKDYIREIDDLESIESDSKLILNDAKSDTEEVIQELNKLDLDLDEKETKYPTSYSNRKRGQSWSNWDNNMLVDLNAESSLSSFSRPASTNDIPALKTKSYTAPETRGQMDYIEFLAKQYASLCFPEKM
ncbi:unnamed protein product [Medioppia subpectinata]|uniref:Uncharacterized protein n=1 Tax=Medioppia subpectinata TaxID=1979941 RepID=A0A7R9KUP0_9ACAR|nr:unnamed protein product [Medioppia subpectinata]CAG2110046.1 unnamed protein product [Medioppia subpectinata]